MTVRLDALLVARGLCPTRSRAADAIRRGAVRVGGEIARKAGAPVDENAPVEIDDPAAGYVSRAALKLAAALDAFGFEPAGRVCLDIGASTGGFSQLLVERGAARVYAVDVGRGQLDARLAGDPRVIALEGVNARELGPVHVPERVSAVVADVSFISLRLVLPPALALAAPDHDDSGMVHSGITAETDSAPDAWAVALFKPQFELGRAALGKGGIVRDGAAAERAAREFAAWIGAQGPWRLAGLVASPIAGADGNREFLIGFRRTR